MMAEQQSLHAVVVPARYLLMLLTGDGQAVEVWAAGTTQHAVRQRHRLLTAWPGYQVSILTLGNLLADELDHVAQQLDHLAIKGGDGHLPEIQLAKRDTYAAVAVALKHRADTLRPWRF